MIKAWFLKLSIIHKLRILLVLASFVGIICTGSLYSYYGWYMLRSTMIEDAILTANMLGNRNVAAIRFNNKQFSDDTLKVIKDNNDYILACIYTAQGPFATFSKSSNKSDCPDLDRAWNGVAKEIEIINSEDFTVTRNIFADGELLGTVLLQGSFEKLNTYALNQIKALSAILLLTLLISYLISNKLQKIISTPILEVISNTQLISREPGNMSIRTKRISNDELGILVDTFNGIMGHMQNQFEELEAKYLKSVNAYKNTSQQINFLAGAFRNPVMAYLGFSELTQHKSLGEELENYKRYQNDVGDSLRMYNTKLETVQHLSNLYEKSFTVDSVVINMPQFLLQFTDNLKRALPFFVIELTGNLKNASAQHYSLLQITFEEMFNIVHRLFSTLIGAVEFVPRLILHYDPYSNKITFTFLDLNTKPESKENMHFAQFRHLNNSEETKSLNTVNDLEVGDEFFEDESILQREDLKFILECIEYLACSNAIMVEHLLYPKQFTLMFTLGSPAQETIKSSDHSEFMLQ